MDEFVAPPAEQEIPDFERPTHYNCKRLGHIFERWSPHSPQTQHRRCVVPDCKHFEVRQMIGVG